MLETLAKGETSEVSDLKEPHGCPEKNTAKKYDRNMDSYRSAVGTNIRTD